jgi:hypothetical protein
MKSGMPHHVMAEDEIEQDREDEPYGSDHDSLPT